MPYDGRSQRAEVLSLTKLQVVPRELPLLIVGQLGRVDEGVVVAFIALDDFPAHLVLGLLQEEREAWG